MGRPGIRAGITTCGKTRNASCSPKAVPTSGGHFVARLTEGADHDRLFDLAAGYASNFASYAIKTEGIRAINVFRLSPA